MIAFDHVGKRYRSFTGREVRALDDLTLELRAGEVFGLAGPNGAGKTTLIALLLGFLGPSEGTVRIGGLEPRRFIERHGVGYLSELVNIPPSWRVDEALRRYALLGRRAGAQLSTRAWTRRSSGSGWRSIAASACKQLSKGNLQRLGLAQALLCEEQVVVLDEPTHGLDPVWTQRFRDVVTALRRDDRVILIASHNLDELARLADRVGILDHGGCGASSTCAAASDRATERRRRIASRVARGAALVPEVFPGARDVGAGRVRARRRSRSRRSTRGSRR